MTVKLTATEGYCKPRITTPPAGVRNWTVVSEEKLTAQYTCNMAFVDMSMSGTVRAYPKLTWTAGNAGASVEDYGDCLIVQSFADMHLHAPQYPMLGMGMDLPLLDWLNAYAFPTEARFADPDYARTVYRQLAQELARRTH